MSRGLRALPAAVRPLGCRGFGQLRPRCGARQQGVVFDEVLSAPRFGDLRPQADHGACQCASPRCRRIDADRRPGVAGHRPARRLAGGLHRHAGRPVFGDRLRRGAAARQDRALQGTRGGIEIRPAIGPTGASLEDEFPRVDEPRTSHASERHHRLFGSARAGDVRTAQERALPGLRATFTHPGSSF